MTRTVDAAPWPWPIDGRLDPAATALAVIDMQVDFVGADGYMHRVGANLAHLREPIAPIGRVLAAARRAGLLVIHTREAFRPDLTDAQPHRLKRLTPEAIVVGDPGPHGRALVRGEAGWQIIPELAPLDDEAVFDKPSYGAFGTTAIDAHLKGQGIRNLILVGVTTDCCIHTNLREALDRGYDCLVLEDCCAAGSREIHAHAVALFRRQSGVFGAVATSAALLAALAG